MPQPVTITLDFNDWTEAISALFHVSEEMDRRANESVRHCDPALLGRMHHMRSVLEAIRAALQESNEAAECREEWPRLLGRPESSGAPVQVMMTEEMVCILEQHLGGLSLQGPFLFAEDDLPTYIVWPE